MNLIIELIPQNDESGFYRVTIKSNKYIAYGFSDTRFEAIKWASEQSVFMMKLEFLE